ncbi:ABC-F family ATP-binding cassette domain-containing protein [Ruminococcus gauvreauii]|uniref:ABC-F family ATP-binding cassette domain-containing protein n=1 Tax=Ruminococcus gauvreauii TaxID=438033 RepID=A0ABY5VGB4_9FIRM|nr:ABC-F family ATP-binding cassette domain-containing protein [Ruminococcus gauvreauii]UWP59302.1 ABC-F family ATP-binding cassette domain-containing protein [Ruminococcus gauvreauii]
MNILNIEHISKVFGDKKIFDDISCGIHEGDKIGIIGINGTGKTTLLRMIAGEEEPDEGQVITQKGLRIAYLPQNPEYPEGGTVLSYVTDGIPETDWTARSDAKSALNKLGITDHDEPLCHLSGGQKKKAALAKTLIAAFDVLLLDEPTNHLDNEMLNWLEEYLNKYRGVIVMVTHDRYFLDRVTNKILEIDHGQLYGYDANYSKFLEMKAQREEMEAASERKRKSVLRMELEWARRGCRARSTKQKARLERLDALKNGGAASYDQTIEVDAVETRMGKKTVELHHISKNYGDKKLIEDFNYIVLKNQRLGIIGPNGCGKSTLLKIIAGLEQPDSGEVILGETIRIGYFAQEVPDMDTNQRVIDYIKDVAEYIPTRDGRITASQMLERFLFTPDMQYAPVSKLSGGEKKRLYLLKVIFTGANVYLFDELSNDIDIPTLTILEDFLTTFPGIIITVSHDRYFLDNVADRIFEFDGNGHLQQYEGGYTDYLETKKIRECEGQESGKTESSGNSEKKKAQGKDWKKNAPVKLKFTYKEQKEFESIDDDIAVLEAKIEKLDDDMMANATNSLRLSELTAEKEKTEAELEEKMERWVYLDDLAERIEAQK